MKMRFAFLLGLAAIAGPAFSQTEFFPSPYLTQVTVARPIRACCATCPVPALRGSLVIQKIAAAGPKNALQLLNEGVARASIVATDLLFAAKLDDLDSVDRVETLLALHPEVIHLIVRSETEASRGSNEMPLFNQVDETRGWRVGGVDSDLVTATALGEQLRLGWVIILFRSTSELLEAVRDQKVEPAVVIASAPSERVSQITGFKLLALRGNIDTLAMYSPATVHYPNLNGNLAVDTLSRQALLVTRSWRSESMQTRMFRLRNCFEQIVPIIQDQPGTNAAWQAVDGASTRVFGHDGLQHVG